MVGCLIFIIGAVIQTACFGSIGQCKLPLGPHPRRLLMETVYAGRFVSGFGVGLMSMVVRGTTSFGVSITLIRFSVPYVRF